MSPHRSSLPAAMLFALLCALVAASITLVHAAVPDAVTFASCLSGPASGEMMVSFTTSGSDGGAPKLFYKVMWGSGSIISQTSPVVIRGLVPGSRYGLTVSAHNVYGASVVTGSEHSCVAGNVPSVPRTPVASYNASTGKTVLSWSAPLDLGGSLTASYRTRIYNASGFEVRTQQVPLSPAEFDSPLPAGTYNWTVQVVTGVGSSATTEPAQLVIGETTTAPMPPRIINVTSLSTGHVLVYFHPPQFNGGSSILRYTLDVGGTPEWGVASPIQLGGLVSGTPYTLSLRAENSVDASDASEFPLTYTPTAIPPVTAPTLLSVEAGASGPFAVAKWSHPDTASHSFVLYYGAADSGAAGVVIDTNSVTVAQGLSQKEVNDLCPRTYVFYVRAVSPSTGVLSPPSNPLWLTAATGSHGPATQVQTLAIDSGITVAFGPSIPGGRMWYDVQWSPFGSDESLSSFHSPVTIGGLTNGQQYQLRIVTQGCSLPGAVLLGTVVPSVPQVHVAPVSVSLNATASSVASQSATVYFTVNTTAVPTWVTLYELEPGSTPDASSTRIYRASTLFDSSNSTNNRFEIGSLVNGQTYSFVAVARSHGGETTDSNTLNMMPYGLVSPPQNFSCLPGPLVEQITCYWAAPASTGGLDITKYQLLSLAGISVEADCCSHLFDGLTLAQYDLAATVTAQKTTAQNVVVKVVSDPTPTLWVQPGALPQTASTVSCVDHAPNITVSWSATQQPGTIPVSGYRVHYTIVGGDGTVHRVEINTTASSGTYTLVGVPNGVPYTFQVFARNSAGYADESPDATCTAAMVPDCVNNLALYPGLAEQGHLHANWTPGANNGAAIAGYQVSWAPAAHVAAGVGSGSLNVTATEHTLTGLTPNGMYAVEVRARNRIGLSASCSPSTGLQGQAAGAPDAPQIEQIDERDSSLALWVTPANQTGGVGLVEYNCSYTSADLAQSGFVLHAVGIPMPVLVSGLSNGVEYALACSVRNQVSGVSLLSAEVRGTPSAPPQSPHGLTLVSGPLLGQINSTWFAHSDTGGSVLTAFNVSWELVVPPCTRDSALLALPATPDAPYTMLLTGLEQNKEYRVTVQALNARGSSSAVTLGSNQQQALAAGPPNAPSAVTVVSHDRALNVSWTAPIVLGGLLSLTSFYVSVTHNVTGAVQWRSQPASLQPTSLIFDGLVNGEWYVVHVVAATAAANSSAAVGSPSPARPHALPAAPLLAGTVSGNTNLTLLLSPPTDLGGLQLTGYACMYNASSFDPVEAPTSVSLARFGPLGPFVVSGLSNGLNYSLACATSNELGTGPYSPVVYGVPANVADAPRDLAAQSGPGRGQINVSWVPPLWQGGSAITGYLLGWSDGQGHNGSVSVSAPSDASAAISLVLTDLIPNTTYVVSVQTRNGVGLSGAASVSALAASVPCPPSFLRAARGNASITVHWGAAPCDGGMALTAYAVRVIVVRDDQNSPVLNGPQRDISVSPSSGAAGGAGPFAQLVSELNNGYVYSVEVWSSNAIGNSTRLSVLVAPATLPSAPTSTRCNTGCASGPSQRGEISLCWSDPLSDGGDEAVLRYNFTLTNVDNGASHTVSCIGNSCPAAGLLPRANYSVTGVAINSVGAGPSSAPMICAAAERPDTIAPVSCTGGNGLVTLVYSAPYSSLPVRYEADHFVAGATPTTTTKPAPAATPLSLITGLVNDVSYTVQVRACNAVGCGVSSEPITCRPGTAPSVPTLVSCSPHNTFVNISFATPSSGSPATGYSVRRVADSSVWNSSATTTWVVVGSLTEDTLESFTLWALNGYGASATASLSCRTLRLMPPSNLLAFPDKSSTGASSATCLVYFTPYPQVPATANFATGFVVSYRTKVDESVVELRTSSIPVSLSGLDAEGASYRVSVRATNGYAVSEPVEVTCATGGAGYNVEAIPSSPGAVVSPGNNQSTLAITLPTRSGTDGPVQRFWVFSSGQTPTPVVSTAPGRDLAFVTVPGLINGLQHYHYVLATQNDLQPPLEGSSLVSIPSAVVSAVPQAAFNAPPAAPLSSSIAITPGDSSVTFEVLTPPSNPSGSPLLGYVVRWPVTTPGTPVTSSGSGMASNSSASLTGSLPRILASDSPPLVNGEGVSFTVEAVNGAGFSLPLFTPEIDPGVLPSPPLNIVASPRNASVEVFFLPPADAGTNPVTGYVIYYRDARYEAMAPKEGAAPPIGVDGLQNGVLANLTICSVSSVSNTAPGSAPLWQSAPGSCASFTATPFPTTLPALDGSLIFAMPLGTGSSGGGRAFVAATGGLPTTGVQGLDDLCLARMAHSRALVCDPSSNRTLSSVLSYRPADAPIYVFNAFLFAGADYSRVASSAQALLAGGLQVGVGYAENFTAFFDETAPFGARGGADSLQAHLASGSAFTGCDARGAHSATGSCQGWTSIDATDSASIGKTHSLLTASDRATAWLDDSTGSCASGADKFIYCAWMPTASDGVQNGDETGVDCGGSTLFHDGSASFPCVVPIPQITCPAVLEVPTAPGANWGRMVTPNVSVVSLIRNEWSLALAGSGESLVAGEALPIEGSPWMVRATVVDGKGQQNSCTFPVRVVDVEPPTITCIPTQTRAADAGMDYASGVTWPAPLSVRDNVNVTSVSGPPPASTRFPLGPTVVTVSAWDAAGNQANCTFTLMVGDIEPPVIDFCPASFVQSTDPGRNYATLAYPQPRASDNVALATPLGYLVPNSTANGTRVYVSSLTGAASVHVSWAFDDVAGNTARCDFVVTVLDLEAPALQCPADVSVGTDPDSATAVLALQDAASVSDNVHLASSWTRPQFIVGISQVQVGAWDERGNEATCSYRVTVSDEQAPSIVCPPDMSLTLGPGEAIASLWWASPNATDNVAVASVDSTRNPGDMFAVASVESVRYTAHDAAGNNASCSFLLRVVSALNPPAVGSGLGDPAISCPADLVRVASYASSPAGAVAEWAPPSLANTRIVTSLSGNALSLNTTFFPVGVHTLTYALVDASGARASCSFRVSVLYPSDAPEPPSARAQISLSNVTTDVLRLQSVFMEELSMALEVPLTRLTVVAVVAAFNRTDVVLEFAPLAQSYYELLRASASRRLLAVASSSSGSSNSSSSIEASDLLHMLVAQLSDASSPLLAGPLGSYLLASTFVNCSDANSAPWVQRAAGCGRSNTTSSLIVDPSFSCPLGCLPLSQCNDGVGSVLLPSDSSDSVYSTQWFAIVMTCVAWLVLLLLLYLLQRCGCISLTGNALPARQRHLKEPPTVPWPSVRDTSFRPLESADAVPLGSPPARDVSTRLQF